MSICGHKCEVFSRVCGYFRPVANYNHGKKEEFKDRVTYELNKSTPLTPEQLELSYLRTHSTKGGVPGGLDHLNAIRRRAGLKELEEERVMAVA